MNRKNCGAPRSLTKNNANFFEKSRFTRVIRVFRKRNDCSSRFEFDDIIAQSRNHDGRNETSGGPVTLLRTTLKNTAKARTVLVE